MLPDLSHFNGSDTVYRHALNPRVRYTEGVQFLAKEVGAYWLLDKIALPLRSEPFQVWKLQVSGTTAHLICEDGNDGVLSTEVIGFTDFPEPGITLWCVDGTILLPSEY